MRELDGERLLDSDQIGDNLFAILARLRDRQAAVRRIAGRIAILPVGEREAPLRQLLILAGLRHLGNLVAKTSEITSISVVSTGRACSREN